MYKRGIQQGSAVNNLGIWSGSLLYYGTIIGNASLSSVISSWKGWLSDCIIGFGVVANPTQITTISANLENNILTTNDLDTIFGIGNYAWWKLDENPGINIDSSSLTDSATSVTAWLSGGEIFKSYSVSCLINTSSGRTDERSIVVNVIDR